jgi:hypothetical protein
LATKYLLVRRDTLGRAAGRLYFSLRNTLRLFLIAGSRGEIWRWLARSLSHQCELTAFASCLSIASASAKAIGPVIIRGSFRLIASSLMKFCKTSSAAVAAPFADGGGLI